MWLLNFRSAVRSNDLSARKSCPPPPCGGLTASQILLQELAVYYYDVGVSRRRNELAITNCSTRA